MAAYWNYRLLERVSGDEISYQLVEAFYKEPDKIDGYAHAFMEASSRSEMIDMLKMAINDLERFPEPIDF